MLQTKNQAGAAEHTTTLTPDESKEIATALAQGRAEQPGSGDEPRRAEPGLVSDDLDLSLDDFRELAKIFPDTMYALTERELWIVGEREVDILAKSALRFWKTFVKIDPKFIIVGTLLLHAGQVYGTRGLAHIAEVKKEKAAKRVKRETTEQPAA